MADRKKYAIIVAGGSGTRMGMEKPKQFIEIEGKSILHHTIEVFLRAIPEISIIVVLPAAHIEYWKDYCVKRNFFCPHILVQGGLSRYHSVKNALKYVDEGALVAVHDGVRPLVSESLVARLFELPENVDGLIPVMPCVDTVKILHKDGAGGLMPVEGRTADRSELFFAQTPQVFESTILKEVYLQPFHDFFTDDASVAEYKGKNLSYIEGERLNIKITTKDDLIFAKTVMAIRK